jgi:hypothetical protein
MTFAGDIKTEVGEGVSLADPRMPDVLLVFR